MTVTYLNYINGEWKKSESNETLKSINPAQFNEVVGYLQNSTASDVTEAVKSAKEASESWRKLPGVDRGKYLYKAADLLEERVEEVAETLTKEMGKTLPEAIGETMRGVAILRYYAGEGLQAAGDVIPSMDGKTHMFTKRVPLGTVGIITPWNFPVAIPIWKMAPALIYGNTVVIKPASEAGLTAAKLIGIFSEAGFPPGVINFVTGAGSVVGEALIGNELVEGISFTGSDTTGKRIAMRCAERGAKYQLEMGGKNPAIIDEDCDLELAIEQVINGALKSTGQKCTATDRVIVLRSIYDEFKEKLISRIKTIKVGNGLEEGVWMGPVASETQLNSILELIGSGKKSGGKVLIGGGRLKGGEFSNGYYLEPTVFEQISPEEKLNQEEIFGPVLTLIPVDSLEEAFQVANNVKYGLSASVFTNNLNRAFDFIDEIEAGMIRVNGETAGVELQAPFGGMKQSSSFSREQGKAAIEFYTSIKTVAICR